MNLIPRLVLCLFALVLLPAAPVHARMAHTAEAPAAAPADSGTAPPCHAAQAAIAPAHSPGHVADAAPDADMAPAHATCCGAAAAADGCGDACACPAAAPALPPPPAHAACVLQAAHEDPRVPASRAGPDPAPPKRPPIG